MQTVERVAWFFSWPFIVKCKERDGFKKRIINQKGNRLENLEISQLFHIERNEKVCSGENIKLQPNLIKRLVWISHLNRCQGLLSKTMKEWPWIRRSLKLPLSPQARVQGPAGQTISKKGPGWHCASWPGLHFPCAVPLGCLRLGQSRWRWGAIGVGEGHEHGYLYVHLEEQSHLKRVATRVRIPQRSSTRAVASGAGLILLPFSPSPTSLSPLRAVRLFFIYESVSILF